MQKVRTNRPLIHWLFGVHVPSGEAVSWDFTTLALRRALRNRRLSDISILEIGVGQGALLCLYLALRLNTRSEGVDVLADRVESSRRVAAYNNVSLRVWQSDLFENVSRTYDLIFFNAAYIPQDFGRSMELTGRGKLGDDRPWNGGLSGTTVIERFLAGATLFLRPGGEIMLGVNNFYVPEANLLEAIQAQRFTCVGRVATMCNPSTVYVLRKENSANEQ